jgi:hypothetical protein
MNVEVDFWVKGAQSLDGSIRLTRDGQPFKTLPAATKQFPDQRATRLTGALTIVEPGTYVAELIVDGRLAGAPGGLDVGSLPCMGGFRRTKAYPNYGANFVGDELAMRRWQRLDEMGARSIEWRRDGAVVATKIYPPAANRLLLHLEHARSTDGFPGERVTDLCAWDSVEETYSLGMPLQPGAWSARIVATEGDAFDVKFDIDAAGKVVGTSFKPDLNGERMTVVAWSRSQARPDELRRLRGLKEPRHEPTGMKGQNQVVLAVSGAEARALTRSAALLEQRLLVNKLSDPDLAHVDKESQFRYDMHEKQKSEHEKTVEMRKAWREVGDINAHTRAASRAKADVAAAKLRSMIPPLSGAWKESERP